MVMNILSSTDPQNVRDFLASKYAHIDKVIAHTLNNIMHFYTDQNYIK
jgi:hypothetical protein